MLKIRHWPDPILFKRCQEWDFKNHSYQIDQLESDMIETMTKNDGIGLAANQVGISYRVLAIHVQLTNKYIVMFNPEIINISQEQNTNKEGCLSFPNIFLKISRPNSVEVRWFDKLKTQYTDTFTDIDATCILHEIDHLDGKVFKDYVSDLKFNLAMKKGKKI